MQAAGNPVSDAAVVALTALQVLSWMLLIWFVVWLTGGKISMLVWTMIFMGIYLLSYLLGIHDYNRKVIWLYFYVRGRGY